MANIDRENLENGGLKRNEKVASDGGGGLQPRSRRLGDGGVLTANNAQENRQQQHKPTTAGSPRTTGTKGRDNTAPAPAVAAATTHTARSSRATEKSTSVMWIRPRSKTPRSNTGGGRNSAHLHHTKMDPVQLYQYYSHEWERFKTNLPGESNRSELRWQIRHKLLGD